MKIKAALLIGLCVCVFDSVCAQPFTIDSCRNLALRNNKNIRMASEAVSAAHWERKAASTAYLPSLDFAMAYTYNQHDIQLLKEDAKLPTMTFNPLTQGYDLNLVRNPLTGEVIRDPATGSVIPTEVAVIPKKAMEYDTHNVWAGAVTLLQPVYMGGKIRAMNGITRYAEALARSSRDLAAQEMIYAVDEAYWLVVSLKAKKRLAESFLKLVDSLQYNVDAMLQEGVATKADSLRVEVKENEARLALTKVNDGLSLSRMALAQICGLPIDTEMRLKDEDIDGEMSASYMPDNYDMEDVFRLRPDLQALRHSISLMEQKEKLSLSAMLPNLAIVGAYTFSNPNVNHGFSRKFGGGFSIGATLSVPLWHWGGNYYRYRGSKAATNVQKLALEDAKEKVRLQVSQARFKCSEAFRTYDMTRDNIKSADENLRCATIGFREGVLTSEDVIAAQTAWLQARSENIDAEIGIRLCNVYLAKVLGTLNSGY